MASSPCSFPFAATEPQIRPMSPNSRPAIVAESAVSFRVFSSSLPGLMPDATSVPASPAASPSPNAVPFTDARALSITPSTVFAEWPRPLSFASASSISRRRLKPLPIDPASTPPIATPAPPAATFKPPNSLPPRPLLVLAPTPPSSFSRFLPNPLVVGTT